MEKDKKIKKILMTIKKHKQEMLSIIMGFLVYVTLVLQNVITNFNILSLLMIIIFILYIQKTELFNKQHQKKALGLAIFFSIITLLGSICLDLKGSPIRNLWDEVISIKGLTCLTGYLSLYYTFLITLLPKLKKIRIIDSNQPNSTRKVFWYSALIIFICYLPYFIVNYPGFFSSDSISELEMVANNLTYLNDHHTVLHALSAYFPYRLGMLIFDNSTIATALIILTQMTIMSLIFAAAIKFLYQRNVNKYVLLIVLGIFALCPIYAFYSITMWKDVIFGGLILLLTIELFKLLEKKKITLKNSYSFIIVSIFVVFFRNNAIYMYIILAIVTLILFRKQIKVITLMLLIVFSTYFIVKGPVYNYFDINTSSSSEYIAIPLQQIGRMVYKDVELTKKEEKLINELIPIETLKEVYNPEIVDSIKFNEAYNAKVFEENKGQYLKLWLNLCIKHFDVATEAYLISTLGYWYPNVDYWTVLPVIDKNELNIEETKLSEKFERITNVLISKRIPIYGFIWSIGLCVWILFTLIILISFSKEKKLLYTFVPIIGIWFTTMIATPVYAEFRYVYSLFTSAPILLLVPYLKMKEK